MKFLTLTSFLLAAIGAINWGLVGAFDYNLVAALFGATSTITKLIYILVGISGIGILLNIKQAGK